MPLVSPGTPPGWRWSTGWSGTAWLHEGLLGGSRRRANFRQLPPLNPAAPGKSLPSRVASRHEGTACQLTIHVAKAHTAHGRPVSGERKLAHFQWRAAVDTDLARHTPPPRPVQVAHLIFQLSTPLTSRGHPLGSPRRPRGTHRRQGPCERQGWGPNKNASSLDHPHSSFFPIEQTQNVGP